MAIEHVKTWRVGDVEISRIVEVNDRMVELYGYAREEMIGNTSLGLGLWVDPEARERLLADARERGRVENYEVHARRKNGAGNHPPRRP